MNTPDATTALNTMNDLADRAAAAMLATVGATATIKGDGSPVTEADIAINHAVISHIADRHPGCGVLGEEASLEGTSGLFVVDPIDGTTAHVAGIGLSSFSCAYLIDGIVTAAVVHDPWTNTRFTATTGGGTHIEVAGRRTRAHVGTHPQTNIAHIEALGGTAWDGIDIDVPLRHAGLKRTNFLAFVSPACRVSTGAFAAAGFLRPSAWDCAAVALIVEEAGGIATTLEGTSAVRDGIDAGLLVAHPNSYPALRAALEGALNR